MNRIIFAGVLFGLVSILGCRKEFSGWSVYYNSKVDLEEVASSSECPAGGIRIKSGLDKNQNNVLDSQEVDQVKMVCHGVAATGGNNGSNADKQILIQLINMTANMNSATPIVVGQLPRFSISNYPGVDSVVFVANPYIWPGGTNTAIIELYNKTDGTVIAASRVTSNRQYDNRVFVSSANIYGSLPQKDITLGVRIASSIEGQWAATGELFFYTYTESRLDI